MTMTIMKGANVEKCITLKTQDAPLPRNGGIIRSEKKRHITNYCRLEVHGDLHGMATGTRASGAQNAQFRSRLQ